MYILITKLAAFLISPMGVITLLILLSLLMRLMGKVRSARISLGFSVLVLVVASSPQTARYIASYLEDQYPPVPITTLQPSEVAVVLGGLLAPPIQPRIQIELVGSSDRLLHTVRIFSAGKVKRVYLSGGNVFDGYVADSESTYARVLLEEWGLPGNRIETGGESKTTYQNAIEARDYLSRNGWINRPVVLVTSALHMPRAVETFQTAGVKVIPVTTDIQVTQRTAPAVFGWLPSAAALSLTTAAWHEVVGAWYYRFRGWAEPG